MPLWGKLKRLPSLATTQVVGLLRRHLTFAGKLGHAYTLMEKEDFAGAERYIKKAASHKFPALLPAVRARRASQLEEIQGDHALLKDGNGQLAEMYYFGAYEKAPAAALLLKQAAAASPFYHPHDNEPTHIATLTRHALGILQARSLVMELPPCTQKMAELLRIQLLGAQRGLKEFAAYSAIAEAFPKTVIVGQLLSVQEDFPIEKVWPKLIAGLYGNPETLGIHPRDIRWRFKDTCCDEKSHFHTFTTALDQAIVQNSDLSPAQKIRALAKLWQQTGNGNATRKEYAEIHSYAGRTAKILKAQSGLTIAEIFPQEALPQECANLLNPPPPRQAPPIQQRLHNPGTKRAPWFGGLENS